MDELDDGTWWKLRAIVGVLVERRKFLLQKAVSVVEAVFDCSESCFVGNSCGRPNGHQVFEELGGTGSDSRIAFSVRNFLLWPLVSR